MPRRNQNPFASDDDDDDIDLIENNNFKAFIKMIKKLGIAPDNVADIFDVEASPKGSTEKTEANSVGMTREALLAASAKFLTENSTKEGDNINEKTKNDLPQNWKHASNFRISPIELTNALLQFTTNQLREMAKLLEIKVKGTQKGLIIEGVKAGLIDYVAKIKDDPNSFLQGLSPEQADFTRKLFTAYDVEGLIPRNISKQFLSPPNATLLESDASKRIAALFAALNERGLLFQHYAPSPELRYRDVYYQWLPMAEVAHYVPVLRWPENVFTPKRDAEKLKPAASTRANFLDAFEAFLEAVHTSGAEWRQYMTPHAKAAQIAWLAEWEHNADEAEIVLNSRRGWSPDGTTGISICLVPHLTISSAQALESQTELTVEQTNLFFSLAAALQLIERPKNVQERLIGPIWLFLDTNTYETWLTYSAEERLRRVWRAWTEQTVYATEVMHAIGKMETAPNFKVMRAIGAHDFNIYDLGSEWCGLRRFVVRALRGLPSQTWVNWPDFRKMLFGLHPNAAHMTSSDDDWWFATAVSNSRLNQMKYEEWQKATGAIIQLILAESLQWLGAIECDFGSNKPKAALNLHAFRITPLGEWLFSCLANDHKRLLPDIAKPQPRKHAPIKWLDDLSWCVPPAPDRAALVTFSRLVGDAEGAPSTYILTSGSIERALRQGVTANEFCAHFEALGVKVPDAARKRFNQVAEHFGRVRIYEDVTVLQLADDIALRELLASTSLAKFIIYQISPRAVVIDQAGVEVLTAEMVTQGHTPKVIE